LFQLSWIFLFVAEENETLKTISRRFGSDAATLLDFNTATIAGLTPKARLQGGTAVRIRCPVKGSAA
jgi:hypothetical protein